LEKVAEACCIEYAAQKVRKAAEAKTREKAKKRRLMQEKKKKQIDRVLGTNKAK